MSPRPLLALAADRDWSDTISNLLPWVVAILIGLVAALGRLLRWTLQRRAERMREARRDSFEGRRAPVAPPARGGHVGGGGGTAPRPKRSVLQEIRRYLEQLEEGKAAPAPARAPRPAAGRTEAGRTASGRRGPPSGARPASVRPADMRPGAASRPAPSVSPARPFPKPAGVSGPRRPGGGLGGQDLGRAILLAEILAPPVALRDPHRHPACPGGVR